MKVKNFDLLQYQPRLQFRKSGGIVQIHDCIRRRYLVQTPEEVVRQLVICFLRENKGCPVSLVAVEKALKINDRIKRFDILVYAPDSRPFLLVECKAPDVSLSGETFFQAGVYNLPLQVPFLMITNGIDCYCCKMDYESKSFAFLEEVPSHPSQSSD